MRSIHFSLTFKKREVHYGTIGGHDFLLRKMFKAKPTVSWEIIEKDVIDEIIFRTDKQRNRLMLELMARGGMRVGEVLKLTPADVNDRRLVLRNPKSGIALEAVRNSSDCRLTVRINISAFN